MIVIMIITSFIIGVNNLIWLVEFVFAITGTFRPQPNYLHASLHVGFILLPSILYLFFIKKILKAPVIMNIIIIILSMLFTYFINYRSEHTEHTLKLVSQIMYYSIEVTFAARCIESEILMHLRSIKKVRKDVSLHDPIGTDKEGNEITLAVIIVLTVSKLDSDTIEKLSRLFETMAGLLCLPKVCRPQLQPPCK